jgi:ferredoxin
MTDASGGELMNCPAIAGVAHSPGVTERVTFEIDRCAMVVPYPVGNTLLETARFAGLSPLSSCETGSCATCMARIVEGSARMLNNEALTDDEVAEGWI